jgi:hypothetical protein
MGRLFHINSPERPKKRPKLGPPPTTKVPPSPEKSEVAPNGNPTPPPTLKFSGETCREVSCDIAALANAAIHKLTPIHLVSIGFLLYFEWPGTQFEG